MRWTSRRYPPASCLLIFGDRLSSPEQVLTIEQPGFRELHASGCEGYALLERVILQRQAGIEIAGGFMEGQGSVAQERRIDKHRCESAIVASWKQNAE
jgi:hypothetical protein